jgi:bifunctional DNase/RNase
MREKEFRILGMSHNQTSTGTYVVVLAEEDGDEKIPTIVKTSDAMLIANYIRGEKGEETIKSNVYDLVRSMTQHFYIKLDKIEVYKVLEGIFYVRLKFMNQDTEVYLECNMSDALVLSMVYGTSIYVNTEVSNQYAIILGDDGSVGIPKIEPEDPSVVIENGVRKLESLIQEALGEENYEKAARLRDEMESLKGEE